MSASAASGKDLNPNPNPTPSPPHQHHLNPPPDGTLDGADPLLQSGAFIDPTTTPTSDMEETGKAQPNGVDSVTPGTSNVTADGSAGRAKAKGSDPQAMDWLPAGWRVEYKVRSSGATAGSTDRYYHDPVSGRRFRSKKEVLHFLETGTLKKNASSDKTSVEGSASKKQRKSSTKPRPAVNFDFFDVPAKVEWVLTDSSQWTWTPFIGDQRVPESTAKEWATAFTVFTSSNSGHTQ
ncbi:putative DNA-binding domain-containing protein [Rosa chinensis]|uniref:Putative DNA-binding domain-containing protein n=1 Tax=Rosa chinensis TaxID=74649 RepID=A0A2P6QIU2_ROSCH|nr:methyl-CpG-binding domain-containing protein 5 [Rosa chinensis]PRQ34084.1 putative DNA-binding domain-containing protein [Rosa chinensis]